MIFRDKDTLCLTRDRNKVGICIGSVIDLDGKSLYVVRFVGSEYFVGTSSFFTLVKRFDDEPIILV